MNIGEGLSRAIHETWRGCQSILFPSRSLGLTQADELESRVFLSSLTITQIHNGETKKAHAEYNAAGNSCSY